VRYLRAPWLAVLLAAAAGVVAFLWEVHDLGRECGYREGSGLHPTWPNNVALVVLVGGAVLLTLVRTLPERRPWWAVLVVAVFAAGLAFAAVFGAGVWFGATRDCYQ
jgi:hypothetical protein